MTDGRQAESTQRAQVPINTIIDGIGGNAILIDTLNRDMAPPFVQQIDQMGGDAAFRQAVNAEIEHDHRHGGVSQLSHLHGQQNKRRAFAVSYRHSAHC